MPTIHTLEPERAALHGHFSRDLSPVLTIDPGDTVIYKTLDAGWGLEPHPGGAYVQRREMEGRDPVLDDGHCLVGPVAIRGAEPGKTLAVEIKDIQPGPWGACLAGGWRSPVNELLEITGKGIVHTYTLDAKTMTARSQQHNHVIALRPFMGVMGNAPAEPGVHSTIPPRSVGGNLDCKELVAGSTLYLPIEVSGALFSVGDGHGVQGDGEVSGTAIECPMDRVELTFDVRDDFPIAGPVARTPAGWLTLGHDADLDKAMLMALKAMFALMERLYNLEPLDAIALASLTVDLRVTQIVNKVAGVHALLPWGALR